MSQGLIDLFAPLFAPCLELRLDYDLPLVHIKRVPRPDRSVCTIVCTMPTRTKTNKLRLTTRPSQAWAAASNSSR